CLLSMFRFFFSSRRRHTRSKRDWSSDVCSSDLWLYHCSTEPMTAHIAAGMFGAVIIDPDDLAPADAEFALVQSEGYLGAPGGERSEERRVGRESRYWWTRELWNTE